MATDYNSMKNQELVSAYNTMAETASLRGIEVTPVKKFKDHSIGVQRCEKLEQRLESHNQAAAIPATETAPAGDTSQETATGSAEPEREEDEMATNGKKKNGKKKVAKKNGKKKVAKPAKAKFGHDKVIVEVGACNRFKGSKAEKLYGQMARYMEKHPKATVAEVIAETDYRRQDYQWDLERKTIKVRAA